MFQSTLPAWGATMIAQSLDSKVKVSIHAPRVGSDAPKNAEEQSIKGFNPRSPRGERLISGLAIPSGY